MSRRVWVPLGMLFVVVAPVVGQGVLWDGDEAVLYCENDEMRRRAVGADRSEVVRMLGNATADPGWGSIATRWQDGYLCFLREWRENVSEWAVGPEGGTVGPGRSGVGPLLFYVPPEGEPQRLGEMTVVSRSRFRALPQAAVFVAENPAGRKVPRLVVRSARFSSKPETVLLPVWGLWIIRPGQPPVPLPGDNDVDEEWPALAPDGRRVAFVRSEPVAPDQHGPSDLWLRDLETGEISRITKHRDAQAPVWSPDGTMLAYHRRVGFGEIWVTDLRGHDRRVKPGQVLRAVVGGFDWMPDGKSLIFIYEGDFFALGLDRSLRRLTTGADACDIIGLRLSPSGRRVAYWTNHRTLAIADLAPPEP